LFLQSLGRRKAGLYEVKRISGENKTWAKKQSEACLREIGKIRDEIYARKNKIETILDDEVRKR
jgi:hypothetical protein